MGTHRGLGELNVRVLALSIKAAAAAITCRQGCTPDASRSNGHEKYATAVFERHKIVPERRRQYQYSHDSINKMACQN